MTPRFLTYLAGSMILPRKLTRTDNFMELLILSSPITMNSALSGFNLSLLFPIHAWTASSQFASLVVLESKFLESSSK